MSSSSYLFEPVIPDLEQWPIVQLSRDRHNFIREVTETAAERIAGMANGSLKEEIARTIFQERTRLNDQPWSVDPRDEKIFWNHIKKELLAITTAPAEGDAGENARREQKILHEIIRRYSREISGSFNIGTYNISKQVLPLFFSRLLNATLGKNLTAKWKGRKFSIHDKIHLTGDLDAIRNLSTKATLVMLPTHFSNLDSVVMGWAIQTMGLPAFLYGAGLNLFGIRVFSYFMNRLGAYKVDRRKKNLPYLETLKTYSALALHRGCHSLFFPGGARSRSGGIESRLKLGLLGSAMDAQFLNFMRSPAGKAKKIIVVPVVINYHFVLEAPYLIDEYLKSTGKEHYLIDEADRFSTSYEISKFLFKLFSSSSDFTVSFGRCMDLFGHEVDEEGRSLDQQGREIDISNYFRVRGELKVDRQRDAEFIKMLGEKVVEEYHRENTVFSSHLVAFTAFELFKKQYPRQDIYGLLRLPEEDLVIPYDHFAKAVDRVRDELRTLSKAGKVKLAPYKGTDEMIAHGIKNVGIYHPKKVLLRNKQGDITTQNMKLLYYYHNRLNGYDLGKLV